jgi:hypothetical protein
MSAVQTVFFGSFGGVRQGTAFIKSIIEIGNRKIGTPAGEEIKRLCGQGYMPDRSE